MAIIVAALNALSIRHVGTNVARVLAEHFGTMDALAAANVDQLAEINEIGPIIAESVHEFLHGEHGQATLADLRTLGVAMDVSAAAERTAETAQLLAGKTLVVTGTLQRFTREQIQEFIRQHGGHASSSVSKKTDYVVAGEKAGSKLTKAQQLGVPVLSEDEFLEMVGEG